MTKKTKPFYLLPYRALAKRWRFLSFMLIPAGVLLWWLIPNLPDTNPALAPLGFLLSGVGLLLTLYTLRLGSAQVHCYDNRFVIRNPIYPVAFSYQRITLVRSVEFRSVFPPEDAKPARWRIYKNLWGKTAIVVDLTDYPMSRNWLRLWFHPFLLHPKETALVLPIEDWMGLSRQLESQRIAWKERKRR